MLFLALRKWRDRPGPYDPEEVPELLTRLVKSGTAGSIAFGILLSALNPKVIALTFAGAANIYTYASTTFQKWAGLAVFTAVASLTLIVPIAVFAVSADRMSTLLPIIKKWLIRNNSAISAAVLLVVGLLLVGNGIMIVRA